MSRRTLTAERRLAAHLFDAVGYPVYREDVVDALAAAGLAVVPADQGASGEVQRFADALAERASRHEREYRQYGIGTEVPIYLLRSWIQSARSDAAGGGNDE